MSDWSFLEAARVKSGCPSVPRIYHTDSTAGFNGMFRFVVKSYWVCCIASDGGGWQHVSVTIEGESKPPTWDIMCRIKDLFWSDEDWVVQFHPAKSEYVNHHPGCLHLWRYTGGGPFQMPTPASIMVGPKS